MNSYSAWEVLQMYVEIGEKKVSRTFLKTLILAIFGGLFIGLGGAVTNTGGHSIANVSAARVIFGLLFPFGLVMVMLLGAELFTGNCMIPISVLEKRATLSGMLHNWIIVYIGNLIGAVVLAAGCAFFGQLNFSAGGLAVFTVKVAAGKCVFPFASAFVLGFFCNILVCAGVLCSLSATDTTGRILGAYIPVAFFVICGFEHCVANMYYIAAGLFAMDIPKYAALVKEAGMDTTMLTWSNFFIKNLLPVTLGNILGGMTIAVGLWAAHSPKGRLK